MNDRRTEDRRSVKLDANLRLMEVINGPAEIADISPSGLRLTSKYLFARLDKHALGEMIGSQLKISIPSEDLHLEGNLVRVAPDSLGMQVHSTTNEVLWQNLCENHLS